MKRLFPAIAILMCIPLLAFPEDKPKSEKGKDEKVKGEKAAEEKPKTAAKKETGPRVDLIRFYDYDKHEHMYTYGEGEPVDWRKRKGFGAETVLAQVALTQEPGTTALYRAVRKQDGKFNYYTKKPATLKDFDLQDFRVYVWTKPGDGRIPMHACFLPDGLDYFMDLEQKNVQEFTKSTLKSIGVKRTNDYSIFWVYPSAAEQLKKQEKLAQLKKAQEKRTEEKKAADEKTGKKEVR